MWRYNEGVITALIRIRQAEIQREIDHYYLARATRAARPTAPPRLAALRRRVRHWTIGAQPLPAPRSPGADREERCSA